MILQRAKGRSGRAILYTYKGKTKRLGAWSRALKIPYSVLYARTHYMRWPVKKALETPCRPKTGRTPMTERMKAFIREGWTKKGLTMRQMVQALGLSRDQILRFLSKEGILRDEAVLAETVSDRDFRTAMGQAYLSFSQAVDQETAARMRRQSRVGLGQPCSRAEVAAISLVKERRSNIVQLLGGLLGVYLPNDNAAARETARALCRQARKRAPKGRKG